MVRVGEVSNGSNGSGWRGGSPSEMFSQDIVNMERSRRGSQSKKGKFWKPIAVLCSVAAVIFFLCAVGLVILLVVRYSSDEEGKLPQKHPQQDTEIQPVESLHPYREDADATSSLQQRPAKDGLSWPKPSGSMYTTFKKATIATDHGLCSEIGRDVMIEGGNAIDATVASLLCVGVVNPQSSGLGGGFLMTLYNKTTGSCVTIDARETAPASANATMYGNNSDKGSSIGYKSVGIPSELHGFWTVFSRFGSGKVAWKRLVEPAMHLALRGFPVSNNLAEVLKKKEQEILKDQYMTAAFVNNDTGRVYTEGEIMRREKLGMTLDLIANDANPVELFYHHGIAQTIVAEFKTHNGYITADDLKNYTTKVEESPLVVPLPNGLSMCGPPPPSSFVVLQSIVRTMAKFYDGSSPVDLDDPLLYHRLIESQKFAYAQRTKLGDLDKVASAREIVHEMMTPEFIQRVAAAIGDTAKPLGEYVDVPRAMAPDHGTSHVSAIDEQGNGVSCTSTVNQHLGSVRISDQLGILWNDEMDDFSTPGQSNIFGFAPSETNFIAPGKRPMSSMSPTILFHPDTKEIKMVTGAAGGSYIISSTASSIIHTVLFNRTVKEGLDAPRFHHQYLPHTADYERAVPTEIIQVLRNKYKQNMTEAEKIASVVQSLEVREDGYIYGNSDFRRKTATYPSGF